MVHNSLKNIKIIKISQFAEGEDTVAHDDSHLVVVVLLVPLEGLLPAVEVVAVGVLGSMAGVVHIRELLDPDHSTSTQSRVSGHSAP